MKASSAGVAAAVLIGLYAAGAHPGHHHHGGTGLAAVAHRLTAVHVSAAPRSERGWARAELAAIGAPRNRANIESLEAWTSRETSWTDNAPDGAEYTRNPLNTTLAYGRDGVVPGTPGVRVYPNWHDGIAAVGLTILGYPEISYRLKHGYGLCGWPSGEFLTWSGHGYSEVC